MEQQQTEQVGREYAFRAGFKQTAKGLWYAEYTVRADTIDELKKSMEQVRREINLELEMLNSLEEAIASKGKQSGTKCEMTKAEYAEHRRSMSDGDEQDKK